jgi:hypothetical protein
MGMRQAELKPIRANAPKYGIKPKKTNVKPLR